MIYTLTLNPSLDYVVEVQEMKLHELNRTIKEDIFVGGKGINVSIILNRLGIESRVLGFVAGFTGSEIVKRVVALGLESHLIEIKQGLSRINTKIKSAGETEINGSGPVLTEEDLMKLESQLQKLKKGDYLVLAGSIPSSMKKDIYTQILKQYQGRGIQFVVDATKEALLGVLPYKPFLIKPNHCELEEIFGVKLQTREDIITYGRKLQKEGAQNVLISLAAEGAILITASGEVLSHLGVKGKVQNSVGAGDSMVAGFLAGYLKSNSYEEAFKLGISAGSATAFSKDLGSREDIEKILKQL